MENVKPEVMHLYITKYCYNNCPLCCNKLYDMEKVPVCSVEELKTVSTVCFTGGEPFVSETNLNRFAQTLKNQYPNIKKIYVYTSGGEMLDYFVDHPEKRDLYYIDGITFSPKGNRDWLGLCQTLEVVEETRRSIDMMESNRLVVFKEQAVSYELYKGRLELLLQDVEVLYRVWDKEFKTPDNEIFRRLPILL